MSPVRRGVEGTQGWVPGAAERDAGLAEAWFCLLQMSLGC